MANIHFASDMPHAKCNNIQLKTDIYVHTRATPCDEVWKTSNLWPLRLGEEKKKKSQDENIMVCPIPYGDHNKWSK